MVHVGEADPGQCMVIGPYAPRGSKHTLARRRARLALTPGRRRRTCRRTLPAHIAGAHCAISPPKTTHQIAPPHQQAHLGADEAALKVGVDRAGRLRRLGPPPDLPALDLVGAGGEEVDEVDRLEAGRDDLGERGDGAVLDWMGLVVLVMVMVCLV